MNAPVSHSNVDDPLTEARKEASTNFGMAAGHSDAARHYLDNLGDADSAIRASDMADAYWRIALRKMEVLRAAKHENLRQRTTPEIWAKDRAFIEMGERVRALWVLLVEAYLSRETEFAENHCKTIREITIDAFNVVKAVNSTPDEEATRHRAYKSEGGA